MNDAGRQDTERIGKVAEPGGDATETHRSHAMTRPHPTTQWGQLVGAAILLAAFALLLYARLLFTNRVLATGDIFTYFYPYRAYAAAALRSGQFPLWNPYIFLGAPFLANPQTAVLYPLHWPLSWLSVTSQIYWSATVHTWLLGLGGYVLARQWRSGFWPSLVTGVVVSGSGFYGGLVGHINQMNGATWLPWLIWVLEWGAPRLRPAGKGSLPEKRAHYRTHYYRTHYYRTQYPGAIVVFALLIALSILAGHTQTAYINLFGAGIWAIWPLWTREWRRVSQRLAIYGGGLLLGLLLSAAQILPTLELSALGLRSGGLSYAEASSFSLPLRKLLWTLLPTYGMADLRLVFGTEGYSEFVAYVGLLGLALAGSGVWQGFRRASPPARTLGLLFAILGFFLAIGRWNPVYYVLYWVAPGFDLFRAPARWMMLYTLGMAVLAGLGAGRLLDKLQAWRSRMKRVRAASAIVAATGAALTALLALELLWAAASLPHSQPTAPEAVYGMRTAPAHLLSDPVRASISPSAMGRFLSMSTTTFDPGDMQDFRRLFVESSDRWGTPQLDQQAFQQLVVALKAQEILAPNLALFWRVPGVDGFDGGVLPLQRYLAFLTLLIDPADLVPDGRLREQLTQIPNSALLGLLNVQYILTDKVRDLWFEDIYYDRQLGARLPAGEETPLWVEAPQTFPATHIHLLGYVEGKADALTHLATTNQEVAEITLFAAPGLDRTDASIAPASPTVSTTGVITEPQATSPLAHFVLTAGGAPGADFADGALDSPMATASGAVVALRDVEEGRQLYRAVRALSEPPTIRGIEIQQTAGHAERASALPVDVTIQAITLVDSRTNTFVALVPSDQGNFRRVHSGDIKIYENVDILPRAYLVSRIEIAPDPAQALAIIDSSIFQPASMAVLEDDNLNDAESILPEPGQTGAPFQGHAAMVAHEPEEVVVQTQASSPALLVLSDVYYPGWRASVDGVETPIHRTNYLFRGVVVPAGEHTVTFDYRPHAWRLGLWGSGAGILIWWALVASQIAIRFRSPSGPGV